MLSSLVFCLASATSSPAPAQKTPYQLGHGYDLSKLDLWGFSTGLTSKDVLTWEGKYLPAKCALKGANCVATFDTKVDQFTDLRQIFDHFSAGVSGGLSGGYKGVAASIRGAEGTKSSNSWFSNSAGGSGNTQNKQTCHSIESKCLFHMAGEDTGELKISNLFNYTINKMVDSKMLSTDGKQEDVLNAWSEQVIEQSGTHLCTQTDNGAAIKEFMYSDISGSNEAQCAFNRVCIALEYKKIVNGSVCAHQEGCSNGTDYVAKWGSNCVGVGGDPETIAEVCDKTTPPEVRWKFLTAGDLDDASSVIAMHFMPLDQLLEQFGYSEDVTKTMGMAIEYHMCKAQFDTGVWTWDADTGACKCTRKCGNGGTLNEDTCTCTCRGNDLHGWRGNDCMETYGHCQPGVATGNREAAEHCTTNNECSSAFHHYACKPTDVCCLTDFHGACCPFGNTCDCKVGHCKCVPPADQLEVVSVLDRLTSAAAMAATQ